MENFSPFQKLDEVLEYLRDNVSHSLGNIQTAVKEKFNVNYELDELKIALRHAKTDGYIHSNESFTAYIITLKGFMFIGYVKQRQLDDERLTSIGQISIATKKYNTRLLWATWCAGIAAALLLLWQVWIWFYPVHKDYPYWFWEKAAIHKKK